MFEFKPDFEKAKQRIDAFWECEIVDRALTYMTFPKPESERVPVPRKEHATLRDRWLDTDFMADRAAAVMANTVWYADAMPVTYPNLGPEIFSAFYGCELEFGEITSWSKPILDDWSAQSIARIQLNTNGFYFKKMMELTDAYIERGRGKFDVGYTDMHPGGDAIAAFRDPQALCLDMIEHPQEVKALLDRITNDFFYVYDLFHERLKAAGMLSTSWTPLVSDGKFHIPSNDFSCMVSDRMFEEVFLPGIVCECDYMDHNIYHLDGPQALRYLDLLLEIPSLQAIQWVYGAGNGNWADWLDVFKCIQAAGRGFQIMLWKTELDDLFTELHPEGAFLMVSGIADQAEADAVLKKIERWGA